MPRVSVAFKAVRKLGIIHAVRCTTLSIQADGEDVARVTLEAKEYPSGCADSAEEVRLARSLMHHVLSEILSRNINASAESRINVPPIKYTVASN